MKTRLSLVVIAAITIAAAAYLFLPSQHLPDGIRINRILVMKQARKMYVFHDSELLKAYTIALGKQPAGKKQFEGDNKTPEGIYYIDSRNPNSDYHLNLGISYPNSSDSAFAISAGRKPGGDIKIHGLPNGYGFIGRFQRYKDWTAGCIAVTNSEIEELFASVDSGAVIDIRP